MRNRLIAPVVLCAVVLGVLPESSALAASPGATTTGVAPSALAAEQVGQASSAPAVQLAAVSGAAVVQYALRFVGYPYTTVGNSPSTGFSCIGFVSYVYQSLGINVPDDLGGAMAFAQPVAFSDLQPGDVLFFQNTVWTGLSHTAIYIGGGRFVHAEWYNRGVVTSSFTNDPVDGNYWTAHYLGANRPWTAAASPAIVTQPAPQTVRRPVVTQPSPAPRVPAGPQATVRVPALNVRVRPSLNAALSAVLVQGARVVVLGPRWWSWYRVALPSGARGWVVGAGIGKGRLVTQTSRRSQVVRRSAAWPARGLPYLRPRGTAYVRVNGLRVHGAPTLNGAVVSVTSRGAALGVLGRRYGWVHVLLPQGGTGWVSGVYVQTTAPSRSVSTRAVAPRAARSIARRSLATSATGPVARIALNVRQRPSFGAPVVFIVPPGASYRVIERLSGWVYVRTSTGAGGWMSSTVLGASYIAGPAVQQSTSTAAGSTASATSMSGRPTITAGVRVHARPGIGSAVLGLAAPGTPVQLLARVGSWARVRLPTNQTGYVYGTYVSR